MYARVINFTLLAPSLWTVVQATTSIETTKGHTILLFKSSENSGVVVELFADLKLAGKELKTLERELIRAAKSPAIIKPFSPDGIIAPIKAGSAWSFEPKVRDPFCAKA